MTQDHDNVDTEFAVQYFTRATLSEINQVAKQLEANIDWKIVRGPFSTGRDWCIEAKRVQINICRCGEPIGPEMTECGECA